MVKFQVRYMHWVGAWWWVCVDDHGRTLYTAQTSYDYIIQAFTGAVEESKTCGQPTEVVIITETDIEHKLI